MSLDGTLLRIDQVGMAGGHDRPGPSAATTAATATIPLSATALHQVRALREVPVMPRL